jgi:octaheme c-type cytochrome (tetrathionate reductase family)
MATDATERTSPASPRRQLWLLTAALLVAFGVGASLTLARPTRASASPSSRLDRGARKVRAHFDHSPLFSAKFESPQAVTRACLGCHPDSAEVMKSSHWLWLGDATPVPGHDGGPVRLGKKNVLNNFCLSIRGNERSCTKCHAGFGWVDDTFDFSNQENVDCLVCHEGTNTYIKGPGGTPTPQTDLLAAARSVGAPRRENCLGCHAYGGGGQAVKHGDLDSSLAHPFEEDDVHIGRHQFLCIDCHAAPHHQIQGRAFSVGVEGSHGVACTDCHSTAEHRDERLNAHVASLACQTCHIPRFAWRIPTKATWDWSKAGDPDRAEDPHHYLKIKGEFTYEQGAVPEYRWFNGTVGRYLLGDPIDPTQVTALNPPRGGLDDPRARIWPFKIHRAKQPYDTKNEYLLAPVTGGEGGYWTTFDWETTFRLGEKASNLPYSGSYGFAATEMYWPLSHMVAPKEQALRCTDCHGDGQRFDWKALGYQGDPLTTGGRK